jgi:aldose 1-epimerase
LTNSSGNVVKIITYGATVTQIWVPDHAGKQADIVLGFDDFPGYIRNDPWFGAIVGRVANRIAKGKFTLDGREYSLEINNPPNNLHSGMKDLSRVVWKGEGITVPRGAAVRFTYLSPDGDEGFPGKLSLIVTYTLTDRNELKIDYSAKTDKATPVNLTNHSYFNLGGGPDILADVAFIDADRYTPLDSTQIPTGEVAPVKGTPLDFTKPTAIGERIAEMKGDPGGYDHNLVLRGEPGKLRLAARVSDPVSGRQLEVWTTEPAVQFYTANSLNGSIAGKGGVRYAKHSAFCLETQHYPDSVNHPNFPSTILKPGSTYRQETIYRFSAR